MTVTTNRVNVTVIYAAEGGLVAPDDAVFADQRLVVQCTGFHPPVRVLTKGPWVLILLGNPIAGDRRNDEAVAREIWRSERLTSGAPTLNGSFVVMLYHRPSGRFEIANDRFASLALFYAYGHGRLIVSLSYKWLFDVLRAEGRLRLEPEHFFEFLYFRRLFGDKTYDTSTRYLNSASVLSVSPAEPRPSVTKYWRPDYARRAPRGRALVDALAERLQNAVALHMSDDRRFGLMLSGGLDSRAVLAAANKPFTCFTTCLTRNNEFQVAAEVAAAAGVEHHFLPRALDLHDGLVDDAVFLTGGMQIFTEAQFLEYRRLLPPTVDSLFLGLAFDVLLTGLYLPKETASVFGRPALHYRLRPLSDDLAGDFTDTVKYRLRTLDPFTLVRPQWRGRLREFLRSSLESSLEKGEELGAQGYDLWEYMHLHNFSRHYSFPMMASVRTFMDCRAPALENNLFDLSLAMRAQDKVNGTVYQRAIARLNPKLMAVRNANTNVRASYSLPLQTAVKVAAKLGNVALGTPFRPSPSSTDRSWPTPKSALDASARTLQMMRALPRSEQLDALEFIDMGAVARVVDEHLDQGRDHAVALNMLLTIDRLLA